MTVESALTDAAAFYTALNAPWADPPDPAHPLRGTLTDPLTATSGDAPVLELMGPLYVVVRVDSSAPVAGAAGARSGVGYVYERGKVQAAGRGLLGFRALTTVDLQSGVRTTTTYRQDFPYIGLPLRTEVRTAGGALLRAAQNTWRLNGYQGAWNARTVDSGVQAGTGSARLGSVQPYLATSVEQAYDLQAALAAVDADEDEDVARLSTVTTATAVDGWGNPTAITVTTEDRANTKRFQQQTANEYGSAGDTWEPRFGRLTEARVTRRRDEGADGTYEREDTRVSTFRYYTSGPERGLLRSETRAAVLEGGEVKLAAHRTSYDYDRHGNRVGAVVRAGRDATGPATERRCGRDTVEYDAAGRYAVKEWDCLGKLRREVVSRNAHGQVEETKRLVDRDGVSGVVTVHSYTAGGRRYFSRAADGSYTGVARHLVCGAQ